MKKDRLFYVIIAIIIIAGVINIYLNKFTFSIAYDSSVRMDVYIGKDYNIEDIKELAKEAIGTDEVLIQNIEIFNDMVAITARDISEEQKKSVIDKINEKYEAQISTDDVSLTNIPHYDGKDLLQRYILPMIISSIIIILYLVIRFNKLGSVRIITKVIAWSAIIELLYVSIISLAKIPVSFYIIPLGIVFEIITLIVLMNGFEKELEVKKIDSKKENNKED